MSQDNYRGIDLQNQNFPIISIISCQNIKLSFDNENKS
jgi:hypothetical protein